MKHHRVFDHRIDHGRFGNELRLYGPMLRPEKKLGGSRMKPLTSQNIESELSYAYIHAIASRAGAGCRIGTRHEDNTGVDAAITGWGPFPNGGYRTEVDLKIQLKATIGDPTKVGSCWSYSLKGIGQYDDLRAETVSVPRILVVLFLPNDDTEWLKHSEDALSLQKCAYWVSLRGAEASDNKTAQQVYLPTAQKFDVDGLKEIFRRISKNEHLIYEGAVK